MALIRPRTLGVRPSSAPLAACPRSNAEAALTAKAATPVGAAPMRLVPRGSMARDTATVRAVAGYEYRIARGQR